MTVLVEACVDSVDSALAAERGGAARIELCDALSDGGTTPSAGMIETVKQRVGVPVFVIVRPRGGGFRYSEAELAVMMRDIAIARSCGADGIVTGALDASATVHAAQTRALVAAAGDRPVTFHRAFDLTRDLSEALDTLIELGIERLLTSGGAATALDGVATLRALVARAAGRIAVMAGGGIREESARQVVGASGVREIHVRGTRLARTTSSFTNDRVRFRKPLPDDEGAWDETDEGRVRSIVLTANGG
ncbi:MAG: copper homeostasis protein CutC [Gemmatimonadaceae bacterium]